MGGIDGRHRGERTRAVRGRQERQRGLPARDTPPRIAARKEESTRTVRFSPPSRARHRATDRALTANAQAGAAAAGTAGGWENDCDTGWWLTRTRTRHGSRRSAGEGGGRRCARRPGRPLRTMPWRLGGPLRPTPASPGSAKGERWRPEAEAAPSSRWVRVFRLGRYGCRRPRHVTATTAGTPWWPVVPAFTGRGQVRTVAFLRRLIATAPTLPTVRAAAAVTSPALGRLCVPPPPAATAPDGAGVEPLVPGRVWNRRKVLVGMGWLTPDSGASSSRPNRRGPDIAEEFAVALRGGKEVAPRPGRTFGYPPTAMDSAARSLPGCRRESRCGWRCRIRHPRGSPRPPLMVMGIFRFEPPRKRPRAGMVWPVRPHGWKPRAGVGLPMAIRIDTARGLAADTRLTRSSDTNASGST